MTRIHDQFRAPISAPPLPTARVVPATADKPDILARVNRAIALSAFQLRPVHTRTRQNVVVNIEESLRSLINRDIVRNSPQLNHVWTRVRRGVVVSAVETPRQRVLRDIKTRTFNLKKQPKGFFPPGRQTPIVKPIDARYNGPVCASVPHVPAHVHAILHTTVPLRHVTPVVRRHVVVMGLAKQRSRSAHDACMNAIVRGGSAALPRSDLLSAIANKEFVLRHRPHALFHSPCRKDTREDMLESWKQTTARLTRPVQLNHVTPKVQHQPVVGVRESALGLCLRSIVRGEFTLKGVPEPRITTVPVVNLELSPGLSLEDRIRSRRAAIAGPETMAALKEHKTLFQNPPHVLQAVADFCALDKAAQSFVLNMLM